MPENEIRRIIKEEMYNFIEDAYTKLKNYSIFSDDGGQLAASVHDNRCL